MAPSLRPRVSARRGRAACPSCPAAAPVRARGSASCARHPSAAARRCRGTRRSPASRRTAGRRRAAPGSSRCRRVRRARRAAPARARPDARRNPSGARSAARGPPTRTGTTRPGTARSRLEVFPKQRKENSVLPLAVPLVRLPLHALAHEADALAVPDRAVVEAVAGELEAVEAELDEEVALKPPRRLVGDATPPVARVHGEAADARDPVRLADRLERQRPRAPPYAGAVEGA